jgi:hypothetical protein
MSNRGSFSTICLKTSCGGADMTGTKSLFSAFKLGVLVMWLGIWVVTIALAIAFSAVAIAMQP